MATLSLKDGIAQLESVPTTLPEKSAVAAYLRVPLDFYVVAGNLRFPEDAPNTLTRISVPQNVVHALGQISSAELVLPEPGSSEDSYHHYYDMFFRSVFWMLVRSFGIEVSYERNRVDSLTSVMNTRPDVLVKCRNIVVLRGEEKSRLNPITDAEAELTSKIKRWSSLRYGYMPYIFVFATSGEYLQIHLIDKSRVLFNICKFNLCSLSERISLANTVIRMALLIPLMLRHVPEILFHATFYQEETIWRQNDKCKLTFSDCNVSKIWFDNVPTVSTKAAYEALEKLSEDRNRPRGLIHAKIIQNRDEKTRSGKKQMSELAVEMFPLGFILSLWRGVLTQPQLESAIRDIVAGLNTWHSQGFCHGDVRFPNIICLGVDLSEWALIDFDHSCKAEDKARIEWRHPCIGDLLCYASDWIQVASLIEDTFPSELRYFDLLAALRKHSEPTFDIIHFLGITPCQN
eukprot:c10488_g1_i2.p1 GENE.c10488_g1_i2~~c10488_g1_i2.p1  ORF type:complete len:484 (+),score=79.29 c10488_g1_i2:74-1453(+)